MQPPILRCAPFWWCLTETLSELSPSCLQSLAYTLTHPLINFLFLEPLSLLIICAFWDYFTDYWHPSLCLRDFFWGKPIQDIDKSITSKKDMEKSMPFSLLLSKCPWKTLLSHVPHPPPHQMIFQGLFHLWEVTHSTLGYTSNAKFEDNFSSQCRVLISAQAPSGHWPVAGW